MINPVRRSIQIRKLSVNKAIISKYRKLLPNENKIRTCNPRIKKIEDFSTIFQVIHKSQVQATAENRDRNPKRERVTIKQRKKQREKAETKTDDIIQEQRSWELERIEGQRDQRRLS
jgi:hypothetical protein